DPEVNAAVTRSLERGESLFGAGTTPWEGRLAELICRCVPSADQAQITNTGSEASYHAMRLARAATGRQDILVMQGGYNGWHDEVACNVMTPLSAIGERVSPGEYPYVPMSAGVSSATAGSVHVINFNDLESAERVLEQRTVACVITEPVLQNIGIVKPLPGYLAGLRSLCARYGTVFVLDEVKTGFRHALGGYQSLAGIEPDLSLFGKAIANGFAIGAIAGKREIMQQFSHPNPARRVLIAGTYNAHPVPVAAAIATLEKLIREGDKIYAHLETLGSRLELGLHSLLLHAGVQAVVARQGSAFCAYFMDHAPVDWHDIAAHHNMEYDIAYRRALIEEGIYHFPIAAKQGSISAAHSDADIDQTLEATERVLRKSLAM
ncbi:MAG TPA: aminotransferase class III-fold pyridoxal phosphate-dependent enzyme, partial [Chthonomonadales bacterium]|nr:aminotransferase class III-fold pyridoxal phosphate-dependent enzyme [Chthonomonadales bacterium]